MLTLTLTALTVKRPPLVLDPSSQTGLCQEHLAPPGHELRTSDFLCVTDRTRRSLLPDRETGETETGETMRP